MTLNFFYITRIPKASSINQMPPNLLLNPRRIRANSQNSLHLLHRNKQNIPRHKPPDPLRAGRTRQAPLVRPEFIKHIYFLQRRQPIHLHRLRTFIVKPRNIWKLRKECGLSVAGIDTHRDNGLLVSFGVSMHEVELGFRAIALHGVIRWCVDVPTFEPDGLIVVGHGGVGGDILVGGVDGEGRAVTPVVQVAVDGNVVTEVD